MGSSLSYDPYLWFIPCIIGSLEFGSCDNSLLTNKMWQKDGLTSSRKFPRKSISISFAHSYSEGKLLPRGGSCGEKQSQGPAWYSSLLMTMGGSPELDHQLVGAPDQPTAWASILTPASQETWYQRHIARNTAEWLLGDLTQRHCEKSSLFQDAMLCYVTIDTYCIQLYNFCSF